MLHKRDKSPKRKGKAIGMSAGWQFTANNYSLEDVRQLKAIARGKANAVVYMIFGKEVGEKGTKHLQGYVHFATRKRFSTVQKLMGLSKKPHLEAIRGTPEENRKYCSKDGDFWEYGELPDYEPGKRNDLLEYKAKIDGGASVDALARHDENFGCFVRYARNLSRYEDSLAGPRNFKSQVVVFFGDPGTFKSFSASRFKDSYEVVRPAGKHQPAWFDGYVPRDHTTVCFDDFYGWMPFHNVLQICDRYQCRVQAKGATKQFRPCFVVFTSNNHPQQWYREETFLRYAALERRIDQLYEHILVEAGNDALGTQPGDVVIRVHKGHGQLHPLWQYMNPIGPEEDRAYRLDMPLLQDDELDTSPTLETLLDVYALGLEAGVITRPQVVQPDAVPEDGSQGDITPSQQNFLDVVGYSPSHELEDGDPSSEDLDGASLSADDSDDSGSDGDDSSM